MNSGVLQPRDNSIHCHSAISTDLLRRYGDRQEKQSRIEARSENRSHTIKNKLEWEKLKTTHCRRREPVLLLRAPSQLYIDSVLFHKGIQGRAAVTEETHHNYYRNEFRCWLIRFEWTEWVHHTNLLLTSAVNKTKWKNNIRAKKCMILETWQISLGAIVESLELECLKYRNPAETTFLIKTRAGNDLVATW